MLQIHWLRSTVPLFGILGTALALAIVAAFMPDSPYLRFQLVKDTQYAQARWIYERIHFDDRPIDVVVVGQSRTWFGVNPARMEEDFAGRGWPAGVVNFSLLGPGRNMNYVIIKDLFEAKRELPKLLVIGVTDKPARWFGHPAFRYVADAGDVARAAFPSNLNYLSNLGYLPFRQMKLAAMQLFPDAFDVTPRFDPASYPGSDYDSVRSFRMPDGRLIDRERVMPRALLLEDAARIRDSRPQLLPASWADIEFGDENFYTRKIVAMARARGVKFAFLSIPYFTGPANTLEDDFYAQYGPIFKADFVSDKDQLFWDYEHLNNAGATLVTDWLADRVASLLKD
jgi:hypothetical protein